MSSLLSSPSLLYADRHRQDDRFVKAVLKDPEGTLEPIVRLLRECVSDEARDISVRLGEFVHHRLLELHHGEALKESDYFNPHLITANGGMPLTAASRKVHAKARKGRKRPLEPITLEKLLNNEPPNLAKLGLIVREALNQRRQLPTGQVNLRWVLEGKHATQGRQQYDQDQTDPIREFDGNAERLRRKIPPIKPPQKSAYHLSLHGRQQVRVGTGPMTLLRV
jgi:hypothetical protein